MSAEENKAIVRRMVEAVWNDHNPKAVGDFHADEFLLNGEACTPMEFGEGVDALSRYYADFQVTIHAMVGEDDRVAYRWTMAGTDPQTAEKRSWRGMSMSRLADGKIVEEWYNTDQTQADENEISEWLQATGE